MCDFCRSISSSILLRHTYMECPLRRSMFCPVCCTKGHRPADCPNQSAWALRTGKPIVVEDRIVKLQDSEEAIRKYLSEHGIRPKNRKLENRKLLFDYANSSQPPFMIEFRAS